MTEAILVLCTCPSEGVANLLASQMVAQRLAACREQPYKGMVFFVQ